MARSENPAPELLTIDEAAALLRKGRSTMYRYLKEGKIRAYQVAGAGRMLFKREELLALLVPVEPGAFKEVNEGGEGK